jgi:hypothetical protein
MKTVLKLSFPLIVLSILFSTHIFALSYYVAKDGSNTNNGLTLSSPFLTIQKASDIAVAGDVVNVRAGVYRERVNMRANGVTFQAYDNEVVTINGADLITSWALVSGSTYISTISTNLDTRFGSNQIFSDGKMIELVRWPNQTSTDIIMPTNAIADNATASGNIVTLFDSDFNQPNNLWVGAKVWVNLSRKNADGQGRTYTVLSTGAGFITFDYGSTPILTNTPWGVGDKTEYFLFNPTPAGVAAAGGIDAVLDNGEWWKDGTSVYVKTPNGESPSTTGSGLNIIEYKTRHFAFLAIGANNQRSNVTIRNFNLFACAIATTDQLNSAIALVNPASLREIIYENAQNNLIEGINAKYVSHLVDMAGDYQGQHIGWTGFILAGRNNTMRNCKIQYSAASAISIQGFGNKVLNCEVADANYFCSNAGAINNGYVSLNTEIANCKIYNTPIMAIYIRSWKNNDPNIPGVARIHHNEIYNCMRRSGDSGAIDMAAQEGRWARIDHNTIYNTLEDAMIGTDKCGVYLDFGSFENGGNGFIGRYIIDHNVIYNITLPILLNKLRDLLVYNNVALSREPNKNSIGDASGGFGHSTIKLYNNIVNAPFGITMTSSDRKNNITNAQGTVLNDLFVDAAAGNYQLKATATAAIDMGISVAPYDDPIVNGIPDIGAFEFGAALPVTIVNFLAKADGNRAKIEWATASEINNSYFVIEKSTDGVLFTKLDKIPSKGNGTDFNRYFAYDNKPASGVNYYKLWQYDMDGTPKDLGVKTLNFDINASDVTVYPNPSADNVFINLGNYTGKKITVTISDLSGKTIYTENVEVEKGKNVYQLKIKNKPSTGQYILNLSAIGLAKSIKLSIL